MSSSLLSISWFGSSGGGLPRRLGLKSPRRFFYCGAALAARFLLRLSTRPTHQTTGGTIKSWPGGPGIYRVFKDRPGPGYDCSLFSKRWERPPNKRDVTTRRNDMAGNGIVEVTDANFDADVLKSDKPVLVDFWATWCGPCRAIAPIVEELAKDYQGKITIGKRDVDANSATPMRYKGTGIPTLLVFEGGQLC